jgi:hypothetical protein
MDQITLHMPKSKSSFSFGAWATLALKWEGELVATCTCFEVCHDGLIGGGGQCGKS